MASFQSALAVLTRVRMENTLARVTNGLGARNIPYVRRNGSQSLAAQISGEREDILSAEADLRRLDLEITQAENRIRMLRLEARRPGGGGSGTLSAPSAIIGNGSIRDGSLAARLKGRGFGISRSKVELGPVEIGKGGLGINNGFIRAVAGRAFVIGLAGNVIGGGMQEWANTADKVKAIKTAGGTNAEAAKAVGLGVVGTLRDVAGGVSGVDAITKGIMRLRGISEEDAAGKMEKFYRDMFSTREEIARRKAAGKAALEKAYGEIDNQIEAQQHSIAKTLPQTFRLRNRHDLAIYRNQLQDVNRGLQEAKREMMRNADKEKLRKARIVEGE